MATVKTSGGKVILKDGKVSCECCSTVCCMYPASGLDADPGYTVDDLPETLIVNLVAAGFDGEPTNAEFNKSVSSPYYYSYTNDSDTWRIKNDGTVWSVGLLVDDAFYDFPVGECLITGDGNYTPEDDAVEDQFDPDYSVDFYIAWDSYDISATGKTVTRSSLCCWTSDWFSQSISAGGISGTCEMRLILCFKDHADYGVCWEIDFEYRNWDVNYDDPEVGTGAVPEPGFTNPEYKLPGGSGGGLSSPTGTYDEGSTFGSYTVT
jgi:hypothetical protein